MTKLLLLLLLFTNLKAVKEGFFTELGKKADAAIADAKKEAVQLKADAMGLETRVQKAVVEKTTKIADEVKTRAIRLQKAIAFEAKDFKKDVISAMLDDVKYIKENAHTLSDTIKEHLKTLEATITDLKQSAEQKEQTLLKKLSDEMTYCENQFYAFQEDRNKQLQQDRAKAKADHETATATAKKEHTDQSILKKTLSELEEQFKSVLKAAQDKYDADMKEAKTMFANAKAEAQKKYDADKAEVQKYFIEAKTACENFLTQMKGAGEDIFKHILEIPDEITSTAEHFIGHAAECARDIMSNIMPNEAVVMLNGSDFLPRNKALLAHYLMKVCICDDSDIALVMAEFITANEKNLQFVRAVEERINIQILLSYLCFVKWFDYEAALKLDSVLIAKLRNFVVQDSIKAHNVKEHVILLDKKMISITEEEEESFNLLFKKYNMKVTGLYLDAHSIKILKANPILNKAAVKIIENWSEFQLAFHTQVSRDPDLFYYAIYAMYKLRAIDRAQLKEITDSQWRIVETMTAQGENSLLEFCLFNSISEIATAFTRPYSIATASEVTSHYNFIAYNQKTMLELTGINATADASDYKLEMLFKSQKVQKQVVTLYFEKDQLELRLDRPYIQNHASRDF